jgi:hypothetical protein
MYCSFVTRSFDFFPEPYKVSWENQEALKKVLGEGFTVEIREDAQAFVVSVRPGRDLVGHSWMDRAEEAFKAADEAAKAKKAAEKAKMDAWICPNLPKPTKLTKGLAKVIKRYLDDVKREIAAEDYGMANCYATDALDLIDIMSEVNAGNQATARRKIENLDTAVRDYIPEDVWQWIHA